MTVCRGRLVALLLIAGGVLACGEDTPVPRLECLSTTLEAQPLRRVPVGTTHYLPTLDPTCGEHEWRLAKAPAGNGNAVVPVTDDHARFTAVLPGQYSFTVEALALTRSLQVIPAEAVPFEHYNYYQGQSVARVGDELWLAAVYSPEIIRLDPDSLEELGRVNVGPWPVAVAWTPGMTHAVVAHKAGDTLGFVDVESKRMVDAVWVGDEPANVVVDADGSRAYVALSTERTVAVVDVSTRQIEKRVETNFDPAAMAIDADGERLFVATHRSGDEDRYPLGPDPRTSAFDVAVMDLSDHTVSTWIESVGSTIGGLLVHDGKLYVTTTRTLPRDLGRVTETPFMHQVVVYGLDTLEETARVDLTEQDGSAGPAVSPRGLVAAGELLWVAAEGSDQTVGLDLQTLAERTRVSTPGRPRTLLVSENVVYAHGAQTYAVTRLAADGGSVNTVTLSGDRRSAEVQRGQQFFTGAGGGFGTDHSCNSCHMDALMDGNLWPAGPFQGFYETRPYFWIEGTSPLGWEGYHESSRIFAYTVINPTVGAEPNTQLAEDLTEYVNAIVPPPPANGSTHRDGSMTEAAQRGRAVFEGPGQCAGCHSGDLHTNQVVLPEGSTVEGHLDTPSLVSIYRHGYWLADGSARTLDEAVDVMLQWTGVTDLADGQRADLVRYLEELTARQFFLLTSEPGAGDAFFGSDQPIRLIFSAPLFDEGSNSAKVRLVDSAGTTVSTSAVVDGRYLTLTPETPLTPGAQYRLVLDGTLESFDTRTLAGPVEVDFTVAPAPSLRLEGEYAWTVDHPGLDFGNQRVAPDTPIESTKMFTARPTDSGAQITLVLNDVTELDVHVVVAGDQLRLPSLPVAIGNGEQLRMSAGWSTEGTLVDEDGDGVADSASGVIRISGPTYDAEGMAWSIQRDDPNAVDLDLCDAMMGDHLVSAGMSDDALTITWDDGLEAIAVYVSDPSAEPPLGPGPMTGGEAYWIVQSDQFPNGFGGPVVYGQVPAGAQDVTEGSGGPTGGAALPQGQCIKVTTVFTDFSTSKRYLKF